MGTEKLEIIIEYIRKGIISGNTKVAIIENSTLKNQRIIIGEIDNIVKKSKLENIKPPAIVIIGDTVNLNENINWYLQRDSI
jgi:siroheme synthase